MGFIRKCSIWGYFGAIEKAGNVFSAINLHRPNVTLKAGVHLKAVFQLGIKLLMQISRLRFKQSRISMLISHIYVLGRCVNFLVIFRYIWR